MATNEEIRAKDILPHKTSFASGDGFYGDGDTSFFMEAGKLLELTAENAFAVIKNLPNKFEGYLALNDASGTGKFNIEKIFENFSGKFDPERTQDDPYVKGNVVVYKGELYEFQGTHYGSWTGGTNATRINVADYFSSKFYTGAVCTDLPYKFGIVANVVNRLNIYQPILKGQKVIVTVRDPSSTLSGHIAVVGIKSDGTQSSVHLADEYDTLSTEFVSDDNYAGIQYVTGLGVAIASGEITISLVKESPFEKSYVTAFDVSAMVTDRPSEFEVVAGAINRFYLYQPIFKGQKITLSIGNSSGAIGTSGAIAICGIKSDGTYDSANQLWRAEPPTPNGEFVSDANYAGIVFVINIAAASANGSITISLVKESPFGKEVNAPQQYNEIRKSVSSGYRIVAMPNAVFNDSFFPKMYTDGSCHKIFVDSEKYKNASASTIYVSPNGTGDGSSESSPKGYLSVFGSDGASLVVGTTYVFLDGIYPSYANGSRVLTVPVSVNLIAKNNGNVVFASIESSLQWIENLGILQTTTQRRVLKVFQKDKDTGEIFVLDKANNSSVAEGQYYFDSNGNSLYVKTAGGKNIANVDLLVSVDFNSSLANISVIALRGGDTPNNIYIEGIEFIGGKGATLNTGGVRSDVDKSLVCCVDCKFIGSYDSSLTYDAVSIRGWDAVFIRCEASYASKDGFNYHENTSKVPRFIEVGCVASNCGIDGVASAAGSLGKSCNGSTAHDGVVGIRYNCKYFNCHGGLCADTTGAKTLNIAVSAFDNALDKTETHNSAFDSIASGTYMYCYNCTAFGCTIDYHAEVSGAYIGMKGCDYQTRGGNGTVSDI